MGNSHGSLQQCQIDECEENARVRIKFMFQIRQEDAVAPDVPAFNHPEAWMPLCFGHSQFAFGVTIPQVWVTEVEKIEEVTLIDQDALQRLKDWAAKEEKQSDRPQLSIVDPDEEC